MRASTIIDLELETRGIAFSFPLKWSWILNIPVLPCQGNVFLGLFFFFSHSVYTHPPLAAAPGTVSPPPACAPWSPAPPPPKTHFGGASQTLPLPTTPLPSIRLPKRERF